MELTRDTVRIVHLRKRIDRHFKFRQRSPQNRQRWAILLGIVLLIALIWVLKRPQHAPDVLATVNGKSITIADFAEYRARLPAQFQGLPEEQLLEQAINELLLLQQAQQLGIAVSQDEIDAVIAQMLQRQNAGAADLSRLLAERHMTMEELRETYRRQLTIGRMLEQALPVQVDEGAIADFYTQYQQAFSGQDPTAAMQQIRTMLERQQRQGALPVYLTALRNRSDVRIIAKPQR